MSRHEKIEREICDLHSEGFVQNGLAPNSRSSINLFQPKCAHLRYAIEEFPPCCGECRDEQTRNNEGREERNRNSEGEARRAKLCTCCCSGF